jgi:hypothetical protein
MELRHPVRESNGGEPSRPAVLRLFREDVRASRRPRDFPSVIRVDAEAGVPRDPLAGHELEDSGADAAAERAPCERHAEGQIRGPSSITTLFAFGYQDGQSGVRTSHTQRTSGGTCVSISFLTWTGARAGS